MPAGNQAARALPGPAFPDPALPDRALPDRASPGLALVRGLRVLPAPRWPGRVPSGLLVRLAGALAGGTGVPEAAICRTI